MDYTKNYHLPQWVKSDRIMMDDFNRMCADIENGLTGNRTEFRQNNSDLSGQIQRVEREAQEQIRTSDTASQASLKTGLLRLAYNHCHMLAAVEKQPPQIGYFFQQFRGPSAPSNASGLFARGDALWLARGTTSYTSEELRERLQQMSTMKVFKDNAAANTPLVIRFTPPEPGYITKIPVMIQFHDLSCKETMFHLALYNENTGEYEAERDFTQNLECNYASYISHEQIQAQLCFSGGFNYRIEISTRDDRYNGTVNYNKSSASYSFAAATLTADTTGLLSRTVQCGEARMDGIIFVHYRLIGTGGTLSLSWDGAEVSPCQTRSIMTLEGKAVTESEFRRNAAIPATTTPQLRTRCHAGGEIALYSWGMAAV